MAFDFEKALAAATAQLESKALEAIVLGTSGQGKSFLMGTFGCPTLYIYSRGESHGPKAAAKSARDKQTGSTIYPIAMDLDNEGRPIKNAKGEVDADKCLARILEILQDESMLAKYQIGAVVLDGAAELENFVRASDKWKTDCKSSSGKHNSFAEPAVTCAMMRPILNRLKELQSDRGIHFAVTCLLDCREYGEHMDVVDASPRLKGYQVAESLIQQFGDVLVVGPMKRDGVTKHKLQFMSDLTKTSKDLNGVVKRAVNFNPRVTGANPPPYLDADLREVMRLKENG